MDSAVIKNNTLHPFTRATRYPLAAHGKTLFACLLLTLGTTNLSAETLAARLAALDQVLPDSSCLEIPFSERRVFAFPRNARTLQGQLLYDRASQRFVFDYTGRHPLRITSDGDAIYLIRGSQSPRPLPESETGLALFHDLFSGKTSWMDNWKIIEKDIPVDDGTRFILIPADTSPDDSIAQVILTFSGGKLSAVSILRTNDVEHHYHFDDPLPLGCTALDAAFP